ncbi:MAG: hypothetical protein V9F03_02400 [Microthrixaceae bacterium]
MRALVIHESLTGNTRRAAGIVVEELIARGWEASECSSRTVDLAALQQADVVVVGTWVDGLILFGQRPGGSGKLSKIPLLAGKPTYGFVTYAVDAGKTLDKLTAVLEDRDGDVRGAMAIRRDQLEVGAVSLAAGIVEAVPAALA